MKKIVLCALLLTTSCLHGLRGFETTTQKAVKKHKAQQLKSAKKELHKDKMQQLEDELESQKTQTISEWALLAQRQPKIEKPFKKKAYSYKPFIRKYDYAPYEEEVLRRRLAYLKSKSQAQNKVTSKPLWFMSTAERIAYHESQK